MPHHPCIFDSIITVHNKWSKLRNKPTAELQSVIKVTGNRLCVRGKWILTDFSKKGFFYFQTAISALLCYNSG